MKFKIFTFLTILSIILTGCGDNSDSDIKEDNITKTTKQEVTYPVIKLSLLNGAYLEIKTSAEGIKVNGYENKPILLVFFASWCPPCKAEIPHLINLTNKYKNKALIIGVSVDTKVDKDFMISFTKRQKINYPVAFGNSNFDLAYYVGGVSSIPAMFLFNKDGKLFRHYVGAVQEEILDNDISLSLK